MIRFLLTCILVGGFLILSIPILLIEWILGKFDPLKKERSSLKIVQAAFRGVLWLSGAKITYLGEEHVPEGVPVLFICNHRSFFDIPLTYTRCRDRTGYVSKKALEKIPLLSNWMRYLHCLFLDREDIRQGLQTILTAIEKVKAGISICIFPEGTRNENPQETELLPFHEGSFKIATRTGCPIIPVAISNSVNLMEAHFPRIRPCHVIVEYGPPIYVDQLDKETKKHVGAYTQEVIRKMLEKNESLV